jgi:hypothetical protein
MRERRLYFAASLYSLLNFINMAGLLLTAGNTFQTSSALTIVCSAASLFTFLYLTYVLIDIVMIGRLKGFRNYTSVFK